MSQGRDHASGSSSRQPSYRERVLQELRTRCAHLLTKEAFVGLPSEHEVEMTLDEPLWWCDQTSAALGADGSGACRERCHGPGRSCYEAPLRP